jgi:hypothetical protein
MRERAWSRIHLIPLLMAEGDRDTYRREQAALEREKEIMKDVKGWEVSCPLSGDVIRCFSSCITGRQERIQQCAVSRGGFDCCTIMYRIF